MNKEEIRKDALERYKAGLESARAAVKAEVLAWKKEMLAQVKAAAKAEAASKRQKPVVGGPESEASAKLVRDVRSACHLTQAKFAELASLSTPLISQLETGKRMVSAKTARLILGGLNCDTEVMSQLTNNLLGSQILAQLKSVATSG